MHTIPKLPYEYNALEPYIDEATMQLHHLKHHQAYVDKLNAALEKYPDLQAKPVEELVKNLSAVPEAIRSAVQNHGGGHYNHSLFWEMIGPASLSTEPPAELAKAFDTLEDFKAKFKEAALGRFGSGWAWLVADGAGALSIVTTANQDNPASQGLRPLLGLDVWEHAYYLKYQNRRAEYVDAFFNVINWVKVRDLLLAA